MDIGKLLKAVATYGELHGNLKKDKSLSARSKFLRAEVRLLEEALKVHKKGKHVRNPRSR